MQGYLLLAWNLRSYNADVAVVNIILKFKPGYQKNDINVYHQMLLKDN